MIDHLAPSHVITAPELLMEFNRAGVLSPIDVHAAMTVGRLSDETDPRMLLAAALAVRATRLGHIRLELGSVRASVAVEGLLEEDVEALPWPDAAKWPRLIASSPLTAEHSFLAIDGEAIYLARYLEYERRVLVELRRRFDAPPLSDTADIQAALDAVVPLHVSSTGEAPEADRQRIAVALAQIRPLVIVAGGPGTGKTWTITRIAATAIELARSAGSRHPQIAIAAPTGKAAQRATEQIRASLEDLERVAPETLENLTKLEGSTIHRLLGWHHQRGRFRHDSTEPLPHDLVIIDEMSMVSLSMLDKLLDAVRPDARIVLVGDPGQLTSIEAGSVLSDILGPAADSQVRLGPELLELTDITGPIPNEERSDEARITDGVIVLKRPRRFAEDSNIPSLAAAIREGDVETALEVLRSSGIEWHETDATTPDQIGTLKTKLEQHLEDLLTAGENGDVERALLAVRRLAVLCAHRRGPHGVSGWTEWAEGWMRESRSRHFLELWYPGRPVMVTANDYRMNLFNGDIGVTIRTDEGLRVAFEGAEGPRLFAPTRLADVTTVYAMTIHKSQGSEFDSVVVVLPPADSPLASRELIYTAVTRAKEDLTVVGTTEGLAASLGRRVARASGLRDGLWGE